MKEAENRKDSLPLPFSIQMATSYYLPNFTEEKARKMLIAHEKLVTAIFNAREIVTKTLTSTLSKSLIDKPQHFVDCAAEAAVIGETFEERSLIQNQLFTGTLNELTHISRPDPLTRLKILMENLGELLSEPEEDCNDCPSKDTCDHIKDELGKQNADQN
jgi:hypothetical protein